MICSKIDNLWLIYFTDITKERFTKPVELNNFKIKSNKIFNHLELYQLKKLIRSFFFYFERKTFF